MASKLLLRSLLVVALVAAFVAGAYVPAARKVAPAPGTAFSAPVRVDETHRAGEPGLEVDAQGRVFVSAPSSLSTGHQGWFWRSTDGGRTFSFVSNVGTLRASTEVGGGDSDLAVTPGGRIYYADLWLGDVSVARSDDGGLTWLQSTPVASTLPSDDRQWLATYGENLVYLAFNQIPYGPVVSRSLDGGMTWLTVPAVGTSQTTGYISNIVADPVSDQLFLAYQVCNPACSNEVWLTTSVDGGLTWTQRMIVHVAGNVGNLFSPLAQDRAGNLYLAYSEGDPVTNATRVFVVSSVDKGLTWSQPIPVSGNLGNAVMPWIQAGDDGRVDVVFYGTSYRGDPAVAPPQTEWFVYFAQTTNAHALMPAWALAQAVAAPNHTGSICNKGLDCDTSVPQGDRSLLDYFQLAIDPQGYAAIIYADNHGEPGADPYVTFTRQTAGTSVYA